MREEENWGEVIQKKKKNVVESNIDKYLYNKHIADFTSIQMHKL